MGDPSCKIATSFNDRSFRKDSVLSPGLSATSHRDSRTAGSESTLEIPRPGVSSLSSMGHWFCRDVNSASRQHNLGLSQLGN